MLAIVLPLVNAGEYLLAIIMPLENAGEYFVEYCLAINECWKIFCWLLSSHYRMLENILLAIVMPLVNAGEFFWAIASLLVNAGEYFVGYCLDISEYWRIFCSLLSCYF